MPSQARDSFNRRIAWSASADDSTEWITEGWSSSRDNSASVMGYTSQTVRTSITASAGTWGHTVRCRVLWPRPATNPSPHCPGRRQLRRWSQQLSRRSPGERGIRHWVETANFVVTRPGHTDAAVDPAVMLQSRCSAFGDQLGHDGISFSPLHRGKGHPRLRLPGVGGIHPGSLTDGRSTPRHHRMTPSHLPKGRSLRTRPALGVGGGAGGRGGPKQRAAPPRSVRADIHRRWRGEAADSPCWRTRGAPSALVPPRPRHAGEPAAFRLANLPNVAR
jgi:hypothetical protein